MFRFEKVGHGFVVFKEGVRIGTIWRRENKFEGQLQTKNGIIKVFAPTRAACATKLSEISLKEKN